MSDFTDDCAPFATELSDILSDKARVPDILRAILNAGWKLNLFRSRRKYRVIAVAPVDNEQFSLSSGRVDALLELLAERVKIVENGPQALHALSEKYSRLANRSGEADKKAALSDVSKACTQAAKAMMKADQILSPDSPRRASSMESWDSGDFFRALDDAISPKDRVISVGHLNRDALSNAYNEIEEHDLCVDNLYMNAREYSDIRKYGRDQVDPVTYQPTLDAGIMAYIWGAQINVTSDVPIGTVYVCASEESLDIVNDVVLNRNAIATITVRRDAKDDPDVQANSVPDERDLRGHGVDRVDEVTEEDSPQAMLRAEKKYRQLADEAEGRGDLVVADDMDRAAEACKIATEATITADKLSVDAQNQASMKIIEKQRAIRRNGNTFETSDYDKASDYEDKDIFGGVKATSHGGGFLIIYYSPIQQSEPRWWGAHASTGFYPPSDDNDSHVFSTAEDALTWAERWRDEILWHVIKEESGTNMEREFTGGSYIIKETVPAGQYDRSGDMKRRYRGKNGVFDNTDSIEGFENRAEAARAAIDIVNIRKASQYK